jgi:hypothetical protein
MNFNLRNALSNVFVGSGGGADATKLPLTGGAMTGPISIPTAASIALANARANGLMFGASAAAANEGFSSFNSALLHYAGGTLLVYNNIVGFALESNVYLSWGSGAATSTQRTFLTGALADATLQLGKPHATTATNQTIKAHNVTTGTGADLILAGGTGSVANGNVRFGTHSAIGAETVTGYITIKDEAGNTRKLAVVS